MTYIRCLAAITSPVLPIFSSSIIYLSSTTSVDLGFAFFGALSLCKHTTTSALRSFSHNALSTSTHLHTNILRFTTLITMMTLLGAPSPSPTGYPRLWLLTYPCLLTFVCTQLPLQQFHFRIHQQLIPHLSPRNT